MSKHDEENEHVEKRIAHLPTIEYFEKTYGKSMEGSDQKAATVFRNFESHEKLRRLQNELTWIKNGKVSVTACTRVLGAKRRAKYRTFEHWAELMLL